MANSSFQKISTSEEAGQQNKLQTIKSRLITFLNFLIIEARKRPFLSLLILLNILTGIAILNVGGRYIAMTVSMDFQLTQLIVENSSKPKIANFTNFTKLKQYKSWSIQNWKEIKKTKGEVIKLNECASVQQTSPYYESILNTRSTDQKKQQQCQEYNYLNKKYNLDLQIQQSRICIVAIANTDNNNLDRFLTSLNQQNYSNYHLHLINRISSDQSFAQKISQYSSISQRVDVYEGDPELGHLSQVDVVMRQQCHSGDIIISTDINKVLIGTQVLNLINRQYHSHNELWFLYTNYFQQDKLSGKQVQGQSGQIEQRYYNTKTTRDSEILKLTGHLRCFLYDLYIKIPIDYFVDDLTGSYYSFAHEHLISFALAQIAGETHTKYFDQYLYLQFSQPENGKQADDCSHERSERTELTLRSNGKFSPLSTLKQKVKVNQKHEVSIQLLAQIVRKQQIFLECMKAKSPKFYTLS